MTEKNKGLQAIACNPLICMVVLSLLPNDSLLVPMSTTAGVCPYADGRSMASNNCITLHANLG
jgi:hypothetical protein